MGSSIIVDFSGGPFDGRSFVATFAPALDDTDALIQAICYSDEYDWGTKHLIANYLDWLDGGRELIVETRRRLAFEHTLQEAGESFLVGEKLSHYYEVAEYLRDGSELLLPYRFRESKRHFFMKDSEPVDTPFRETCDFF